MNHTELDIIWDQALIDSMCKCSTDDEWEQDISGYIFCSGCKNWIVKPADFEERQGRRAIITEYEFEEGKGLSGILFPNGNFLKCGNSEHYLLISDIPLDIQFRCIYFSSTLKGDWDGIITHSPIKFHGVTNSQLDWIDKHIRFFDAGQMKFDCKAWNKNAQVSDNEEEI